MSSGKRSGSISGEEERYAVMDEKKRRRMISNRESARRSRMKREQHMKDLNDRIMNGTIKRNGFIQKINEVSEQFAVVESENMILRAQREELRQRLEIAEMVTGYVCESSGNAMDIPPQAQGQDFWLRPWQPHVQGLPMMTSAGISPF
ncbi:unnamed protein product [Ilex paraguariensis]|uniref:BZIP domain-containing protein n=1 Tax=Ilex paraguariensis TaxID=185542 RepID=A0ABC8RNB4_9AQUA